MIDIEATAEYIAAVLDALPDVDEESEAIVDELIEAARDKRPPRPLTRRVKEAPWH